jgi:hypothetical protein
MSDDTIIARRTNDLIVENWRRIFLVILINGVAIVAVAPYATALNPAFSLPYMVLALKNIACG